MAESDIRVELKITGRVQGVFYRDTARRQARALGVCGWVKNCADGSVEAVAEGAPDAIEAFIAWCHEGSSSARVDAVNVERGRARDQFGSFEIQY